MHNARVKWANNGHVLIAVNNATLHLNVLGQTMKKPIMQTEVIEGVAM